MPSRADGTIVYSLDAPAVNLQLSDQPRFESGGGRVVALHLRDAAMLAYLALEGPTARSRLAALLWPDRSDKQARGALRQRLFQLRRQVGVDLVLGDDTLFLASGVAHDLDDADGVLGGEEPGYSAAFIAWLAIQRQRRRHRAHQDMLDLCRMAEAANDLADALAHGRELLALEPLSEEAHRRVMRLHYLSGDRAAALLAFDACERMLKDEVGARPSAETLAVLATVEGSAAAPSPASLARAAAVPVSVLRPPRLVGRETAWQTLQQVWDHGGGVVVTGEGGIGKSRLVSDFARDRPHSVIASARPGDKHLVYASFTRLLRALPAEALQTLDPPLRSELSRLLPELGEPGMAPGEADPARLLGAVRAALDSDALALEGIVFDDLHFADDASIELLQQVLGNWRHGWLITARPGEVSPVGRQAIDELLAHAPTVAMTLSPLTLAQVGELVDSLGIAQLAGAAAAPALSRHTGGNPLYLLETVKAWLAQSAAAADAGSPASAAATPWPARLPIAPSLQALIERRIGQLSPMAVQLARCAAVAAQDFSVELASSVLGCRTLDLADPWAELERAQVFRDGAFAHDLIHESTLACVPGPIAGRLHAEIAGFLETRGGEPARLAQHWTMAGQWARAGQAWQRAAARAQETSRLLEQCALLEKAARCFEREGLPAQRFDALLTRARTLVAEELGSDAGAAVQELQACADSELQHLLALEVRLELTMIRYEIDEALRLGRPAIERAIALGRQDLALRFAVILSGALCDARQAAEAVALLSPFAPWIEQHGDPDQTWSYWDAMALSLDYADRLRDALPAWEAARQTAERAGRRDMVWKTMANAASTQAKMGLVRQAVEAGQQARQLAMVAGEPVSMRMLQMHVTLAHRLRDLGHYAEALGLLEAALHGYEAGGGSEADKALTEHRLVILFQQLGQPARARALLAHERPGVPRGVTMIRLAHRAELEQLQGRDGLPLMREALQVIANADDVYHRITSLLATRLVPPDEGEAMAAGLAHWAAARERYGVALSGHVRAAACAWAQAAPVRALPHVVQALQLAERYLPDSFYLPEMWLVATRVLRATGQPAPANRVLDDGLRWVKTIHATHVPQAFQESFLHRNAVNQALASLGTSPTNAG